MTVRELMDKLQKIVKGYPADTKVEANFIEGGEIVCARGGVNNVFAAEKENGEIIVVIEAETEDEGLVADVEDVLADATKRSEETDDGKSGAPEHDELIKELEI